MNLENVPLVPVTVEVYGTLRLRTKRKHLCVEIPQVCDRHNLAFALSKVCPELVGIAINNEGTDIKDTYAINLNGLKFLDGNNFHVNSDDSIILLSNQAGG